MIDREKVIKALECCDSSVFDCEHCSYGNPLSSMDECHDRLLRDAWELLKEQEGIVRCKDCKHSDYGTNEDGEKFLKCIGSGRCYGGTTPDWFCADGERREKDD